MDNLSHVKSDIAQLVSENSSVGIVASDNQTLDVLSASLSLHLIFQDSGKNSQIVSHKDPTVEHSFLVGIDQLGKSFSGLTKTLTVSFPYRDGDIEKVSYNIEGDKLNVNLFAEEQGITFTEKDIKYIRQGSSPQLIFTVGVTQMADIQDFIDQSAKIINIDTSASNGMFGQVNVVDAAFSSLSEVVAKLAQDLALQVEFDVAQNLLDGISSATQNFSSPKTSPLAFEMAGFLMQKGAIRKNMKDTNRSQSTDTSLQALGKNPNQGNKQFSNPAPKNQFNGQKFQPKPFAQPQPQQNMYQPFPPQQPQPMDMPQFEEPYEEVFAPAPQPQQPQQMGSRLGSAIPNDPYAQTAAPVAPRQPQPSAMPNPQAADSFAPQNITPELPTEDEAPSDWFVPKVFKSNKNQG